MITNGRGGLLNILLGSAENGRDVFIYTHSQLVAQDNDTAGDIYDARIGGGIPEGPPVPVECEGDACSTPASPPSDATPSSLTFSGVGNVTPAATPPVKKKVAAKKVKSKKKHKKKKPKVRSPTGGLSKMLVNLNAANPNGRQAKHALVTSNQFSVAIFLTPFLILVACLVFAGVAVAMPSAKPFEIERGSFRFVPSTFQAGAHGDWVVSFNFAHDGSGRTYNDVRSTITNLPAGFDANDTAVPTCTDSELVSGHAGVPACPVASQIGMISFEVANPNGVSHPPAQITSPVYNMEVTSFGVTAEIGFKVIGGTALVLQVGVRPGDYGLTTTSADIQKLEIHNISVTIWGLPAAHEHDAQRGEECGQSFELPPICDHPGGPGGPQEAGIPVEPYLSNPTSCGAFTASLEADSWEEPFAFSGAVDGEVGPIAGCERVPFEPSIEVNPSTRSAESPTGLEVSLVVPQAWDNPFTISSANLKDARVTLPEGMTANPGLAEGLGACTPEQYASETSSSLPGAGCPAESKIGSIVIETPLLGESIPGAIYIATPYDNPFPEAGHPNGSLLALYVVAKDPQRGIIVKVAGKITPNPVTGQLVTTFDNNPQQPFSKFTLKFRPGATAPLISPPACGSDAVNAELTPWSSVEQPGETPVGPRLISSQPFQVTQGTHEGPCPTGGVPPFHPQVISGTQNNAGGSYSPFYLRILREDGEQEITRFSTTLPPGLTGNLSGIPFCPDADIEASRGVSGQEEQEHPSCPQTTEIGHTIVSAGVGSVLAQTPGKVYLAGPYNGAPLSIVSITSAKVGPFDLGTVVIRFALDINPTTAQVEVSGAQSEAIPRILRGIVVHVREIRVYMDRPNFTLNPTNCNPLSITNTIDGAGANPANPTDQDPVTVNTPFEGADCSSLKFEPKFTVSTSGKTSKALGASLTAKLTVPAALGTQANIREVKVDLPKQLPSRLTTLQKACTAAQFNTNPAGCPAASNIGHAKAITPILPVPLEGPVYFVSHGGEAFPSLEIVLQGYGFTINLVASTFISKPGITSSTFHTVPDQPVTSFEITLPEGKYSALAANGSLCAPTKTVTTKKTVKKKVHGKTKKVTTKSTKQVAETLAMPTAFIAQNGAEIHQSTPVTVSGCAKAHKVKTKKAKRHGKNGKK